MSAELNTRADEIRRQALDLLARREHSTLELRRKLSAKGHDLVAIEEVLNRLSAERLLSDERFAEAYLTARINKGYGPAHIQSELRGRGISDELIAKTLAKADICWQELLEQVRRKKFARKIPPDFNQRAKQMRFLQYRGFTAEQIRAAFKQDEWE